MCPVLLWFPLGNGFVSKKNFERHRLEPKILTVPIHNIISILYSCLLRHYNVLSRKLHFCYIL